MLDLPHEIDVPLDPIHHIIYVFDIALKHLCPKAKSPLLA